MISHPCIKPWVQLEYSVSQQLAFPRQQGRAAHCWTSGMRCQGSWRWRLPAQSLPHGAPACGTAQSSRTWSKGELHFAHPLCCARGELASAAALQHVGRGQMGSNWMEEERLLTNTCLQRFPSKVTLTVLHNTNWVSSEDVRALTTKKPTVLLPNAVLSWAVQHSWPVYMDTLQPLWVLWLGLVWFLDFFPLNGNYSQSSFSGFSLFFSCLLSFWLGIW